MQISTWLTHPEVPCFNFSRDHADLLEDSIKGARVQICHSREEFAGSLATSEVVLVWTFEQEWFQEAPCLKWIVTPAAGRDYFQVEAPAGIKVDYCSFHGELIAETVLAMLLSHCRGLREADLLRAENPWPRKELAEKLKPLRGSRLTILGLGNIGRWIAKLAKPFGVQVSGICTEPRPSPDFFEAGDEVLGIDSLDSILPQTDHLVIALPSGPATDGLIGARRLYLLPRHASLSNIGRGNSVDEKALAGALESGKLAAAWLDVFNTEPLEKDSPLYGCRNAFLMPHCAAVSPNYLELFCREFIKKSGESELES